MLYIIQSQSALLWEWSHTAQIFDTGGDHEASQSALLWEWSHTLPHGKVLVLRGLTLFLKLNGC